MLGITLGSFAANICVEYGRRRTIIYSYLVILLATAMTLVLNYWLIVIGKLIFSFASGLVLITSNVFINETIPRAQMSLFGNVINFGIVTGIFMQLAFGLAFPSIDDE